MPFRCFASSGTSPVAELAARDAPAITGDAFLAFIGVPPGCPTPVRERDASEGA